MKDDRISVIQAADVLGVRKQMVFKMLKRLGIESTKEKDSNHRGQAIAFITLPEFDRLRAETNASSQLLDSGNDKEGENLGTEPGEFYIMQLEPEHDPGRFKLGFGDVAERLRSHKCSAPFAKVLGSWPCKRLWERTAIDCVSAGCERIHTEVFRTDNLERVVERCRNFFEMMPDPN